MSCINMVWRQARRDVSSAVAVKMRTATRSTQTFSQSLKEEIFKSQALGELVTQAIIESVTPSRSVALGQSIKVNETSSRPLAR